MVYLRNVKITDEILKKVETFRELCTKHNVKSLYAFGSSTSDQFDSTKSDIDLLVEIDNEDPIERGDHLLALWDQFEQFFQRKVDLLTDASIKNPYLRESIDATKVLIYDARGKKIFS